MLTPPNTRFQYHYYYPRGHQPASGTITLILAGRLEFADLDAAMDHGLFIPSQVGLPEVPPGARPYRWDDHPWHTCRAADFTPTAEPPTTEVTAAELRDRLAGVRWNEAAWTAQMRQTLAAAPNTELVYLYLDNSGCAPRTKVVVAGRLTFAELAPYLEGEGDRRFFIPSQVGLADVPPEGRPYEARDGAWHLLLADAVVPTCESPTEALTAADLRTRFTTVQWDEDAWEAAHLPAEAFAPPTTPWPGDAAEWPLP